MTRPLRRGRPALPARRCPRRTRGFGLRRGAAVDDLQDAERVRSGQERDDEDDDERAAAADRETAAAETPPVLDLIALATVLPPHGSALYPGSTPKRRDPSRDAQANGQQQKAATLNIMIK